MANPEHVERLKAGIHEWNTWRDENPSVRPDLSHANLANKDLRWADLSRACLKDANLGQTTLSESDLSGADLEQANLMTADLSMGIFARANLTQVHLHFADLRNTEFPGADFSLAQFGKTRFSGTNLADAIGLDSCNHHSPSPMDNRTLQLSGPLPVIFLRGCGLSDWEIEAAKLFQQGLTGAEINLIGYKIITLRSAASPIQFYSCFISYSSDNEDFTRRLHDDLQAKGVRCYFAPEDPKIGDEIRPTLHHSIQLHDRLLLILSASSIGSQWVQDEVETAFEKERRQKRTVLFPIRLDDAVMDDQAGGQRAYGVSVISAIFAEGR